MSRVGADFEEGREAANEAEVLAEEGAAAGVLGGVGRDGPLRLTQRSEVVKLDFRPLDR